MDDFSDYRIPNYYYFRVVAVDNDGNESETGDSVTSTPMDFSYGIIIINDDRGNSKNDVLPLSDGMSLDDFYDELLGHYAYRRINLSELDRPFKLEDICRYSTVFWHRSNFQPANYIDIISIFEPYIKNGGNVIFSSFFPSRMLNPEVHFPKEYDEDEFIRKVFGIAEARYHATTLFKQAKSHWTNIPDMSPNLDIFNIDFDDHVLRVEAYTLDDNAEMICSYNTDHDPDTTQGMLSDMAVGTINRYGKGQSILLSLPLYNIHHHQAKGFIKEIIASFTNYFDYTEEYWQAQLLFSTGYPNPFKDSVRFALRRNERDKDITMRIYNLKGQKVRKIEAHPSIREYSWDGCDDNGKELPAGIYFIQAKQGKNQAAIKVIKL